MHYTSCDLCGEPAATDSPEQPPPTIYCESCRLRIVSKRVRFAQPGGGGITRKISRRAHRALIERVNRGSRGARFLLRELELAGLDAGDRRILRMIEWEYLRRKWREDKKMRDQPFQAVGPSYNHKERRERRRTNRKR